MEIIFSPKAQNDLNFWGKLDNLIIQRKIEELILAISENPFEGIGKPEKLKYSLTGKWSRKINSEYRIIYKISEREDVEILDLLSLKVHYE